MVQDYLGPRDIMFTHQPAPGTNTLLGEPCINLKKVEIPVQELRG